MAGGDVVDMHDVEPGIDKAPAYGPRAASRMSRPVGVGLRSRGPTGVEGLTMTAGSPRSPISRRTTSSACEFRLLVGADHVAIGSAVVLVGDAAGDEAEGGDAAGIDDALDAGGERRGHQSRVPSTLARNIAAGSGTHSR